MRTCSSSNLHVESSPNPTSSNPKRRNRRRSKQPFILEESPIYTMADQRTMEELLRAITEGYAEAIVVPLILAGRFELKHIVPLSELEKIKRMNETNMKVMQTQINNVKNELINEMKILIQASMSNQTNELKNMMASFFQMNIASTSGLGPLPSNTIANLKGESKAITTRSGIVLDGPFVLIPPPFINPEEDERVEETLTDQDLAEDPLHPNIPYPSSMHKQKHQEKDEGQIHKFWQMFKQIHINITLVDALILILKYHKMLKYLLSNKEKLLELVNIPLNENCSAVILKNLPKILGDPGKFLIPCDFSELKCKALADLGASINLMPLSVWKKLGLPELISTRMTLELANQAIYTPAGIARDVFVLVGKFTFPADFVIVDCESDPRVPLILGRTFLHIARDLIDDFLEDLFATNHQSGNPTFSSHPDLTSPEVKDDIFDPEGDNVLIEKVIKLDSTKDLLPPHNINPLSGSTTSSSPNHLLEEFGDELALITFPPGNDDLPNLANPNDNLFDTMLEMFTDEHALYYSSPSLYDEYDDDLFKIESETEYVYDDPFDSKGEKIKESKLLIDELDPLRSSDFLPSLEYDSFLFEDFFEVDAFPSTNNKDKVFNPECSSCGALYNKSCGCSKGGFVYKFVRNPNKTPDSSQRPPHECLKCGNPVDGLHCRQCALLRKKLKKVWFTICDERKIFLDFLNTSESSNDYSNVVNAPQEPFVFNQDPGKNSSQSPPYIDHHCCYGCGDSLDGIFCQQCTCESCGNGAHYGYNCPPKVPIISNPEPCHN
nr:hypothetical protein [Tanacetum cinerariifolium]